MSELQTTEAIDCEQMDKKIKIRTPIWYAVII